MNCPFTIATLPDTPTTLQAENDVPVSYTVKPPTVVTGVSKPPSTIRLADAHAAVAARLTPATTKLTAREPIARLDRHRRRPLVRSHSSSSCCAVEPVRHIRAVMFDCCIMCTCSVSRRQHAAPAVCRAPPARDPGAIHLPQRPKPCPGHAATLFRSPHKVKHPVLF